MSDAPTDGPDDAHPEGPDMPDQPPTPEQMLQPRFKVRAFPTTPGVYLMKDDKGRVIYVGKSASLRERVASYFQAATKLEFKKQGLLEEVVDFEFIEMESEVEALLAENRLIKDVQPKYNARLLDDKTFPYLMITLDEDYPGVFITRQPRIEGAKLHSRKLRAFNEPPFR